MVTLTDALMEGPPVVTPRRVTAGSEVRGRRVAVWDPDREEWRRDLRAADEPFYVDGDQKWPARPVGDTSWVPSLEASLRAVLHVAIVSERDWFLWQHTRRRPEVGEYPAYLVWLID